MGDGPVGGVSEGVVEGEKTCPDGVEDELVGDMEDEVHDLSDESGGAW